ncbi:MAG: alkaline phosphatase family protein [Pseudomonadota bacterium]
MTAKVLFIGMDGADPGFVDAMIANGELPAFKRLRDQSAAHAITNDPGMGAAHFWTSASIGAGAGHHAHYFFMQFKPESYDVLPNHESSLPDITPFWNELDEEGYRVAVIDWHRMHPKPLKNGILIDNWLGHDPLTETIYHPPSLADEAGKFFHGDPIAGGFESLEPSTPDEMADYLHHQLNRANAKAAMCTDQLESKDWDLFFVNFSEIHDIGHHYYHIEDETSALFDPDVAAKVKNPMRQCYRRLDGAITQILEAAGPDANIFFYGGPGMETFVSANNAMEEIMRRIDLGVGAPLSVAETAQKNYRSLIPKKLRRTLAPMARAVKRRVGKNDFASRRFFAIPHNDNAGGVRINVKGREKYGRIEPGTEYDAVIEEIERAVATFINPDTGKPIVKRVVRVHQENDGPHRALLPDLYIEWDRDGAKRNLSRIVSDAYGEIDVPPAVRTGDHNPLGFFWAPADTAGQTITRPAHITTPVVDAVRAARNQI